MASFEGGAFATDDFQSWLTMWRRGASDWAAGTLDWPFPFLFDNWNFPYMCGTCKRGEICNKPLMRCNKCKISHYCCREHQLKAWPIHKHACKYFQRCVTEFYNPELFNNQKMWKFYLMKGNEYLRTLSPSSDPLQHRVNSDEWYSQRHCQVCFFNPAGPIPDRKLVECITCHCAAHCSTPECTARFAKLHTAQACEKYLITLAAQVISIQGGGAAVEPCLTREKTYNLPRNWSEYYARKINDVNCHPLMMRMPPIMVSFCDFFLL